MQQLMHSHGVSMMGMSLRCLNVCLCGFKSCRKVIMITLKISSYLLNSAYHEVIRRGSHYMMESFGCREEYGLGTTI
jgi:hypothetical protein